MTKTTSKSRKPAKAKQPPPPEPISLKEQLAQQRKAARQRKELISFTVSTLGFAVVVGMLLAIVGGIKAAAGAVLGILCLALSFKYPRQALWGFLIYVPFGGTITYIIGNSPLLQLAKDGIYLPALFGLVQYCRREQLPLLLPKIMVIPLGVLLFFGGLTWMLVNGYQEFFGKPGEHPLAMGVLGFKVLLGYLPLISCSYYLLRDRQDVQRLMRLTVAIIITCCSLALIQYLLLLTGKCEGTRFAEGDDLFKATLSARCFVGGALVYSPSQGIIRLPGTFVAPWQWGWFLISASFLAFSSAFTESKPLWRILGLVALGLVFVMAVVSGQRIALALVPSAIALLLIVTGQVANLKRFLPIAIILGLALGVAAVKNPDTVAERLDSFISRWNASPPYEFILQQLQWAIVKGGWLGNGLGRATNSARALGETELVETYYPKLIYEMGPFGAIAFLVLVSVLTFAVFKANASLRDRTLRSYGAPLCWFTLFISYNTYYYPLDVDPVAVYFWFYIGVVLKLPEIERRERLATLEENEPEGTAKKKKPKLKRQEF